jgi:hypothetical protein
LQASSRDQDVMSGVVETVLIGGVLTEEHEREGVEGKKYMSPPEGPSRPSSVGEEGVSRPVCFCRASGEREP